MYSTLLRVLVTLISFPSAQASQPLYFECQVAIHDADSGQELHRAVLKTFEPEVGTPIYNTDGSIAGFTPGGKRWWGAGSGCLGNRDVVGPVTQQPDGRYSGKILVWGKDRVLKTGKQEYLDYCFKMADGTQDGPNLGYAEIYLARRPLENDWLASSPIQYLDRGSPLIIRGPGKGEVYVGKYRLSASCQLTDQP